MYMKKNFFYAAALAMGLTFSMTACSNEDQHTESQNTETHRDRRNGNFFSSQAF